MPVMDFAEKLGGATLRPLEVMHQANAEGYCEHGGVGLA